MHDGVKPFVSGINAEDRIDNLSVILQVHQDQARASFTRAVKVQHLVSLVVEPLNHAPTELSGSACNSNLHLLLPRYRYSILQCYPGSRLPSPRTRSAARSAARSAGPTGSRLLMTDGSTWRDCWRSTSGDATSPYLHAVVVGNVIRVIAGTTLWTSTDGCATWAQSVLPIAPDAVAFPTDMVGYIVFGDQSGSNREAHVFRTADGGQHWTATAGKVTAIPGPYGFYGPLTLSFADADHGWLTDSHTIWATSNGGRTWTKATLPVPGSIRGKLDFITAQMVGVDGSAVLVAKYDATPGMDGARGQQIFYRTVDRGAHWTAASIVDDPGMLTLSLVDPTTWVVLDPSEPPSFQTTTDAGSTWQTVAVREPWPYNSGPIDFADSLHGWMVVSEPYPPCPGAPQAQCDYAFAPPQHLVATDVGGATWHELKP